MPKLSIADFQRFNPRRTLTWRYDRVQELIRLGKRPISGEDSDIVKARRFISNWHELDEHERMALFPENPGLWYAYDIFNADDYSVKVALETRLLAGQSDEAIAQQLNTLPEAIGAYERMFYNVRDRLNCRDWIQRTALYPAMVRGSDDAGFEFSAKIYGYFGGPMVADEFLYMCDATDRPSDIRGIDQYLERQLTKTLKRRSLQVSQFFEINRFNVIQLFSVVNETRQLEHVMSQGDTNKTDLETTAIALMSEIKFVAGLSVQEEADATIFDVSAVELRADEAQRLLKGEIPQDLQEMAELQLPPPHKKKPEEQAKE